MINEHLGGVECRSPLHSPRSIDTAEGIALPHICAGLRLPAWAGAYRRKEQKKAFAQRRSVLLSVPPVRWRFAQKRLFLFNSRGAGRLRQFAPRPRSVRPALRARVGCSVLLSCVPPRPGAGRPPPAPSPAPGGGGASYRQQGANLQHPLPPAPSPAGRGRKTLSRLTVGLYSTSDVACTWCVLLWCVAFRAEVYRRIARTRGARGARLPCSALCPIIRSACQPAHTASSPLAYHAVAPPAPCPNRDSGA